MLNVFHTALSLRGMTWLSPLRAHLSYRLIGGFFRMPILPTV